MGLLEDSGMMHPVARIYPWMSWHWWGVPCALRASPNAKTVGEPSEPGGEANVGLECSALHHGEEYSAAHYCGSQVDGRDVLQGGAERVVPRGPAPASALSCWWARGGGIGPHVRTGERRGGREVKESVLNFWQTAGSRLTLFEEQTINSFM